MTLPVELVTLLAAVAGAVGASLLACIPGLHVYNVFGLLIAGSAWLAQHGMEVAPETAVAFAGGMMVGYSMLSTIPSVLLAAPDESAFFTVLPGQKFCMQGRGYEAIMLTAAGGLAGLFVLVVGLAPLAPRFLPPVRVVLQDHLHWILWTVITFMLMAEWPKGGTSGQAGWRRLLDGWKTTGAGLFTFLLAGWLGFVLMFRSPIAPGVAFQNLMPAFVGLFTIPWLLLNVVSRVQLPPQRYTLGPADRGAFVRGVFAGALGGGFAAFFPVITGGVGGMLAGHATALRDDRSFLVSQGTSKLVYYVGAFMLLFVPGLTLTRGGGAMMMRMVYVPTGGYRDYFLVLAAIAVAGTVSFFLVGPLTRATIALSERVGYRRLSWAALAMVVALVWATTGAGGLGVMAVATGIGLIPVLYGSRRMNCLGVILLPIACNMSGIGPSIAAWLRLT